MKIASSERRVARRYYFKAPLRVRRFKISKDEFSAESENLSEHGIFFATESSFPIGTPVEIFLRMPEEVTGEPATDWLCTGHVVRIVPSPHSFPGRVGVGVKFDCYEIWRPR